MFKKLLLSVLIGRLYAADGDGGGGTPPGSTTTTPPPGGTTAPPPDGGTPPAAAWYDSFKDPATKDWLKSYGSAYPDAESVAMKALNLEKFVGAEKAGRGVIVPKADAKPEEWKAFYAKTGMVPEKIDGYKLPESVAKNAVLAADPLVEQFRQKAHAEGIPMPMFNSVLDWYAKVANDAGTKQLAEFERKGTIDMEALKQQWPGVEYDKNVELGRRAATAFLPGKSSEQVAEFITRMEGAVGTKETLEFFATIGKGMGEHNFIGGEGSGGMGGMTPEGARVRIDTLKKDADWQKKFLAGGADEKAEWNKLHSIAYTK